MFLFYSIILSKNSTFLDTFKEDIF